MSLRSKVLLLLSCVVLAYAIVDHALQRTVIFGSFVDLENSAARRDCERVAQAFQAEIEHLDRDCGDWAGWEETQRIFEDESAAAGARQLFAQTFDTHGINLLFVCGEDGRVLFSRLRDLETGERMRLRDFPEQALSSAHPLIARRGSPRGISGIFPTEHGALLVAARPIGAPDENGRGLGTLFLGRLVDDALVQTLERRTSVPFDVWQISDPALPEEAREHLDEATASSSPVLFEASDESLQAFACLADIREAPAILVRATLDRAITTRGSSAVRYALLSTISAGLLLTLVLLSLLQRAVIAPIAELTSHAVAIGKSDDVTRRIGSRRGDEVGVLAREFDSMLGKLADSRAQIVDTARAAGMSEIATGVLHNVGNVLNSVNVSAALVSEKLRDSGALDLKKVVDAVRPHGGDLATFVREDPRGAHLFPLLESIADGLASEHDALQRETTSLVAGLEHVKELVQAQQSYAGRSGVREKVAIQDQVEAALAMTERVAGGEVRIERRYAQMPAGQVDRHRLLEILVNVLQNARQSVVEAGRSPGCITVAVDCADDGTARVRVTDDGAGIPPENLSKILNHGFTTKPGGHGFGLHASANAATEIGGKLTASSDGPGRGATFTIEFPFADAPATAGALA